MLGQQPKPPVGKVDRKEVAAAEEEVSPKSYPGRVDDAMGFAALNPSYALPPARISVTVYSIEPLGAVIRHPRS